MGENPASISTTTDRVPRVRVPKQQAIAISEKYARASHRARKAMVTAFLMQGQTPESMSKLLNTGVEEVRGHYNDALEEIQQEFGNLPEGPLHASEIVIEGYSRLVSRILAACEESQQRIGMQTMVDPKAEMAVQGYMKLSIEAMDALTNRMEKYGLLPMGPRQTTGARGSTRGKEGEIKEKFQEFLKDFAAENNVDLEGEIARVQAESVGD